MLKKPQPFAGVWVFAVLTAILVVGACRNLDLPAENTGANPGPTLRFVSPVSSEDAGIPEVSLTSFVSVDAQDADGVGEVDLSCTVNGGQVALIRWVGAPYEGLVDLSPCRGATIDSGSPDVTLVLTATGTDALGNQSAKQETVQVRVNVQLALISVEVPAGVPPGTPFDITVTSDRALIGPPTVKVGGTPADFVQDLTADGGTPVFLFHTVATPQLGAASYSGSGDPPLEVLEEDSQLLTVTAEGRALNGNLTQVQAQVNVSRVLWTRALPAALSYDAGEVALIPHAVQGGIYIPILQGALTLPGYFRASDGQPSIYPLDMDSLYAFGQPLSTGEGVFISRRTVSVQLTSTGDLALGPTQPPISTTGSIDSAGIPLYPDGGSVSFSAGTPATLQLTAVTVPGAPGLVRPTSTFKGTHGQPWFLGDYACEDAVTNSDTSVNCKNFGQRSINCVGLNADIVVDGGTEEFDPSTVAVVTHSGSTLAFLNAGVSCADRTNVSPIKLAPLVGPKTGFVTFPGQNFDRVLPEGNGSFFGSYSLSVNGVAVENLIEFNLSSGSTFTPTSLATVNGLTVTPAELAAARFDHTVVVFLPYILDTVFGLWSPQTGRVATSLSTLPLVYQNGFSGTHVTPTAEVDSDNSVYLLLHRSAAGVGSPRTDIVALDPFLKPKWIYRYPRADLGVDNSFRITLDRVAGQLYLVDGDNGFVTALAR